MQSLAVFRVNSALNSNLQEGAGSSGCEEMQCGSLAEGMGMENGYFYCIWLELLKSLTLWFENGCFNALFIELSLPQKFELNHFIIIIIF